MSSTQSLIPILRTDTKTIVGGLNIGSLTVFDGTETTVELSAEVEIAIVKHTPDTPPREGKNPWLMVMEIDRENFRTKAFEGYADFVPLSDMLPDRRYMSPSGSPNVKVDVPGVMLDILSSKANIEPINPPVE